MLEAHNISHTYHTDNGTIHALDDVNLTVAEDEFACLVGPSGSGKSTLLRILAGIIEPTHGSALLNGMPVGGHQQRIGYIFQQANLMPWRTVLENIALPLELEGLEHPKRLNAARQMSELVGLSEFEDTYPAELSGGMAQRVAIARALIHEPDVLLLDEPFGQLDAITRETLGEELLRIWNAARHSTVLMVTHSISEAVLLADRVFVMSPRPGHIDAAFDLGLPRPRSVDILYTPDATEISRQIRSALDVNNDQQSA